ncbi:MULTISPECIES: hypothetical protein [unclassified Leucobacter]|uniref:hypothetical protein n=1 Tax=unclassified Leucobacter TaxID=2621730 RepID=UPI000621D306|nr:hypothetical protein [Leucobacter sp. Ag1]KKI17163.1 hypothetical protein XM48_11375 [Leucobacter sp. Ag1]
MSASPPRIDRWPVAVRSAARLRGVLTGCGPGLRGIGWPESPAVRLVALAAWIGPELAACGTTAAWVWGARRDPGHPLHAAVLGGRRARSTEPSALRVHEYRLAPTDLVEFDGLRVTSRVRTAEELLFHEREFGPAERASCRLLVLGTAGGADALRARVEGSRRPHRARARTRLRECGLSEDQPPLTR